MDTDETTLFLTAAPATAYREYVYRPAGRLARRIEDRYDIVARPGQGVDRAPKAGDLLIEVALGRMGAGRCQALGGSDLEAVGSRRRLQHGQLLLRQRVRVQPAEPVAVEPVSAEPSRAEPTGAEPTRTEPTRAEPTRAAPTRAEPASAEPASAEPDGDVEYVELDRLIDQGLSENQITNTLFYARHPAQSGATLQAGSDSAREWQQIRNTEVRPGVRRQLVIGPVDPAQLAVFLSQYENDSRVPAEYTKRFLTGTPLLSMGRTLRERVIGNWRNGGRPLTALGFYELALETAGDPGTAELLCHNVAKAFVREGVAITWRGTGTEGEYTDGQKTYQAKVINSAGRLRYYHDGKKRDVVSIFYLLFSAKEFGSDDPGDWYHYFVTATMTALASAGSLGGRLGTTAGGGRREDVDSDGGSEPTMAAFRGPVSAELAMTPGLDLEQALALPRVTEVRFRNTGTSDADNCCAVCPVDLGIGAGATASNGMELRFRISGHRSGIEYDITRTRRDSLWQRVGGVWTRLGSNPMGTNDDHRDTDECLTPRGGFIFAVDRPGIPTLALPAPAQALDAGALFGAGTVTSAAAQDLVYRLSFGEWVIARSRSEGVSWTPLELPPFGDGTPRRFIFWRCVVWIRRDGAGNFVLDAARSRIELGSLSAAVLNAEPV